jgi:hypothetical protein
MTAHMGPPDNGAGAHVGAGAGRVEALGGGYDSSIITQQPTDRQARRDGGDLR